jgi:hypothetical protein
MTTITHALARTDDPATSHEAARHAESRLGLYQWGALQAVRSHPGMTATEMAHAQGWTDPRVINRRLVELERLGKVRATGARPCSRTGRRAMTWEAT